MGFTRSNAQALEFTEEKKKGLAQGLCMAACGLAGLGRQGAQLELA